MAIVQEMVWFLKISLPLGIFNNQFRQSFSLQNLNTKKLRIFSKIWIIQKPYFVIWNVWEKENI